MKKATFSLAKALHYVMFAIAYFEDAIITENMKGDGKRFILELTKRLKWVMTQMYTRMSADGADLLRNELNNRDIHAFDSVIEMMLTFSEEERANVEDYVTGIYNNKPKEVNHE